MNTHCLVTVSRPVRDVLNETPQNHLAMFEIVSATEDDLLGERVYFHNGHLYDFLSDTRQPQKCVGELRFISYVPR